MSEKAGEFEEENRIRHMTSPPLMPAKCQMHGSWRVSEEAISLWTCDAKMTIGAEERFGNQPPSRRQMEKARRTNAGRATTIPCVELLSLPWLSQSTAFTSEISRWLARKGGAPTNGCPEGVQIFHFDNFHHPLQPIVSLTRAFAEYLDPTIIGLRW
jgi:hypothetical protein